MGFAPRRRSDGDYEAVLRRLFRARRFGMELGLERMVELLGRLGDPHLSVPARIAIGGTNGKGSTAAFLAAIVRAHGASVGVFSSPHVSRFAERYVIDGAPASESAIVVAADRLSAVGGDRLTFFEQCTALAAILFAEARLDVGIFEVGLGGRLDATRALGSELVVLTGVDYDHTEILGDTLAEIAAEKAGVIDPGDRVVIGGACGPEGIACLRRAARARDPESMTVVDGAAIEGLPARLGLAGSFQRTNAAAAAVAAEHMSRLGWLDLDPASVAEGLAGARLPGRFETVSREPLIVIDGAHNPGGARALAAALREHSVPPLVGLCGLSSDKDAAEILAPLVDQLAGLRITRVSGDRAMATAPIAAAARGLRSDLRVSEHPTVGDAIAAVRRSGEDLLVFGSLHLAGAARSLLFGEPGDPIELTDPR